jgi:hypothetical protein
MEIFKPNIGVYQRLESIFGNMGYDYSQCALYEDDHTRKWTYITRDLFWGVNKKLDGESPVKEGAIYLPDVQWLISKHKTEDGRLAAFAAKGGNNDEPHNHNDLGHFILHYKGFNLLSDLGCPEYTREFFRDETRYGFINASSLGHSVPVINGQLQKHGPSSQAKILNVNAGRSNSELFLDLTGAYGMEALRCFTRKFSWTENTGSGNEDKLAVLDMEDRFEFDHKDHMITEAFITQYKPEILEEGRIRISQKGAAVLVEYDKSKCSASIEELRYSGHLGEKRTAYRIALALTGDTGEIMVNVTFSLLRTG